MGTVARMGRGLATAVALLAISPIALMAALAPPPIIVDSIDGYGDGDGCTLGEAIENANARAQPRPDCGQGFASPFNDIRFSSALTAAGPVVITEELPTITSIVEINGPGAHLVTLQGGTASILRFASNGHHCKVSGLTLRGGSHSVGAGGALTSDGVPVLLSEVRVVGSRAHHGGGISVVNANLAINFSEISGNVAQPGFPGGESLGGAIYVVSSSAGPTRTVFLNHVTISGNRAQDFGGAVAIEVQPGAANVDVDVVYATVADNAAGVAGGGFYLAAPSESALDVTLDKTVLGDNAALAGPDLFEDLDAMLTGQDSIVETTDGHDVEISSGLLNADPRLTPLSCNGGRSRTHLLQADSPAIDLVPAAASGCSQFSVDQRGFGSPNFSRKVDGDGDTVGECDAGALEFHPSPPVADAARRSFFTLPPCRLFDTRWPDGPNGGPSIGAQETRSFVVAGQCGVPSTAVAVAVNVTAVGASEGGSLLVYEGELLSPPDGDAAAVVPYAAELARANNAVLSTCPSGSIQVRANQSSGTVDFVLDVVGYFD